MTTVRVRKRGVEPGVWPRLHEKWRMDGWFTTQNCTVEIVASIFRRLWMRPCGEERKRERGDVVCGGFSGYDEMDLFILIFGKTIYKNSNHLKKIKNFVLFWPTYSIDKE